MDTLKEISNGPYASNDAILKQHVQCKCTKAVTFTCRYEATKKDVIHSMQASTKVVGSTAHLVTSASSELLTQQPLLGLCCFGSRHRLPCPANRPGHAPGKETLGPTGQQHRMYVMTNIRMFALQPPTKHMPSFHYCSSHCTR